MRHRRMLAPINSVKHYVHQTNANLASGVIRNQVLVDAVTVAAAGGNAQDVTEGSLVKAVHLDFWCMNEAATGVNTQFNAILEKVPTGQAGATAGEMVNLGAYENKKNILNSFQGNLAAAVDGAQSLPYMQGWFKIPKGKQRFGVGDSLVLSLLTSGATVAICGLCTYKEYT